MEGIDFGSMFTTIAAFVAATIAITQVIKTWVSNMFKPNDIPSWLSWVISFVVGIVFSMLGWFLKLGCFATLSWYVALGVGCLTAFSSQGVFDSPVIQMIIQWFTKTKKGK